MSSLPTYMFNCKPSVKILSPPFSLNVVELLNNIFMIIILDIFREGVFNFPRLIFFKAQTVGVQVIYEFFTFSASSVRKMQMHLYL